MWIYEHTRPVHPPLWLLKIFLGGIKNFETLSENTCKILKYEFQSVLPSDATSTKNDDNYD